MTQERLIIEFDHTKNTPLCEIMGRNKSDKGQENIISAKHNYTTCYHHLWKHRRYDTLRIFELGIGTNNIHKLSNMGKDGRPGASLYGWAEYFPFSQVFGADIDTDILFRNQRIETFYCDQTNPQSIKQLWAFENLREGFDFIIEDGLHTFFANICFFENSIHKLNLNGYYIIEDIVEPEKHLFEMKLVEWETRYPQCRFCLITIPSQVNQYDNTLLIVHKFRD